MMRIRIDFTTERGDLSLRLQEACNAIRNHLITYQADDVSFGNADVRVNHVDPEEEARDERIRAMATALQVDGEVEIDDGAVVSEGDDNGAYVAAWVWVSFEGTDLDKDADEADEA